MQKPNRLYGALALLLGAAPALADDLLLQRVLIEGNRLNLLGLTDAASAGTVGQKALAARTVYRPGELLEAVPGLIASQHSGEGKANQFYLRGFNLDHGTDLATWVDGMPVNQRSHAHGQGWTDVNFLIPELVGRLDYRKGPYAARDGDFASAGSAELFYTNRLVKNIASATLGENGFRRALLAGSPALLGGTLLYALEATDNDGPWTRPDDYRKRNAMLRYSRGFANNGWSISAMAYRGRWNATDQIPLRAVDSGALGRFDAIDDSDGGNARRTSVSGVWRRTGDDTASSLNAYLIRNELDLYSNFTYFLNDPVNGDQFAQPDRRVTSGLDATHTWHLHEGDTLATSVTVGTRVQNDNIFNGLYATRARARLATTRADHIVETSGALFIESVTRWNPALRSVVGLRAERYRFAVASDLAQNSGSARDAQLSPKFSLVYAPLASTELYANYGHGFHSNDARSTVATLDPASGAALTPAPGLVRSRGMELGLRSLALPGLTTTVSLYRLDFDSELRYVGDAGTTEAGAASKRTGIEWSTAWQALPWLAADFDAAYARARSRGADPAATHIPGAVEGVAQASLLLDKLGPWSGALRLRYFGPRPLVDDNSVRSRASTTVNGRVGYKLGKAWQLELEAFNLANRRASAIDYYYASQLAGEAAPREDIHFHPIEPRTLRLTLTRSW